jgi:predicted phage terminase large subunit-like protein
MIFPGVELTPAHSQVNNWRATNQSGVIARSVRSKLTGRKVDWLIVDDPHAGRDEAESVTMREKVHRWYFGDCVTRLSPGASVFMIQTRWHPHDLIGKLIDVDYREELRTQGAESELFQVVNLPAVCEDEENDPLGRKEGEALFPQVRNETFLNAVRATIPSYEWESQYMGRPRSASTNMINVDAIEIIEPEEVPEGIMKTRGWDTALTEKQTSDWSVGAKCGILFPTSEEVSERKKAGLPPPLPTFYILDLYREKLNWPKLKAKMQAVALADLQNDGIGRIGMEAVAGFEAAYMEIRQLLLGRVTVERRNPVSRGGKVMDKLMRAQAWINLVEAGQVKMVRARWNKDLRSEMEVFPEGEHDDQIDAITIAYEVFTMGKLLLA